MGTTVAERYLLTGLLGRGGFGVVYSGHDLTGGGEVAVKVFSRAEGFAPRAAREARTASKLDHPNIHAVRGVEEDADNAYLVSQLVVGSRLDRTELSDEEAVRAVAAVCDALAHAHARNVVHRDVKPANILVAESGEVVLTDFGIARDRDAVDQTIDEKVLGTLSYMAPEQARGDQSTGKTDVWAAALTLYEALAGVNPFRTKALSDLLERLGKGAPPLSQSRPDLPKPLTRAVMRALDQDPARRPTADEFRDQLIAALRPEDSQDDVVKAPTEVRVPRRARALERAAAPGLMVFSMIWLLDAFPVYPAAWTLPLAVLLGLLTWRAPLAGACAAAAVAVPAMWNHSEAAALVFVALAGIWIRCGRKWGGRMFAPLAAIPLAVIGLGPAVVFIASTAPTARRRAAEGAAGGLLVVVAAGVVPAHAAAPLAGADDPFTFLTALAASPGALLTWAAIAGFAPLLHAAMELPKGRRGQALALWTLGFALVTVALPTALTHQALAPLGAAAATALVGILCAVWALAAPRLSIHR